MLTQKPTVAEMREAFEWDIPERFNMGVDVCDRIVERTPDAPAIIDENIVISFSELKALSNQIANVLSAVAEQGDRIAVLLPQCCETAAM